MKKLLLLSLSFVSFALFSAEAGSAASHAAAEVWSVDTDSIEAIAQFEARRTAIAEFSVNAAIIPETICLRFQENMDENDNPTFPFTDYSYSIVEIRRLSKVLNDYFDLGLEMLSSHSVVPLSNASKQDFDALLHNDFSGHTTCNDFIRLFRAADYLDIRITNLSTNDPKTRMLADILANIIRLNDGQIPDEILYTALLKDLKPLMFIIKLKIHKQLHPEYFFGSKSMEEIAQDIVFLRNARRYDYFFGNISGIPNGFSVQDLIFCELMPTITIVNGEPLLRLSYCLLNSLEGLENVPGIYALQNLDLSHNLLTILPDSIGLLTQLKNLNLSECYNLTTLHSIGQLTNLQWLNLNSCSSLTTLPDSIGQLVQLISLHIHGCRSLTTLPYSIGQLRELRTLDFERCYALTTLPDSIGRLNKLRSLRLFDCPSLITLPDSIVNLRTNLRRLDLRRTGLLVGEVESLRRLLPAPNTEIFF